MSPNEVGGLGQRDYRQWFVMALRARRQVAGACGTACRGRGEGAALGLGMRIIPRHGCTLRLPSRGASGSSGKSCAPALFQPQCKVKAQPGPNGVALRTAAPYKHHGGNYATRSLRV